jgi:protein-S-isoprenylcysteine O-methyltransferase Ste14
MDAHAPLKEVTYDSGDKSARVAIGTSLLLGSWYGLLLVLVMIPGLVVRAVLEERVLLKELPGYDAYMAQVKYRLIPYVW